MNRTLIITAAPLLALAACGQGGHDSGHKGAQAPNQAPANVTISTAEGRVDIRSGAGAVADMPEGIPVYPGAQAAQGVLVSGGAPGGQGQILGFTTADPPARVLAFYGDAVRRAGFSISQQMNAGSTAMLLAQREDEGLSITATRIGAVTQIQIIAGQGR